MPVPFLTQDFDIYLGINLKSMSQIYPPPSVDFSITQNIPVADHVFKYLFKCCGSDHITATRNTAIGSMSLSLLGRNYDLKPSKKKYTKIFKVTILEHYYEKTGMHISKLNAQLFNDQADKNFREEMYRYLLMHHHLENKLFIKTMRNYLDFYNINEDDIKVETLYRDFKRKKEDLLCNLNLTSTPGTKIETSKFVPKN